MASNQLRLQQLHEAVNPASKIFDFHKVISVSLTLLSEHILIVLYCAVSVAFLLVLICSCLVAPHDSVASGTTSLVPISHLKATTQTQNKRVPEVKSKIHSKYFSEFYKLCSQAQ